MRTGAQVLSLPSFPQLKRGRNFPDLFNISIVTEIMMDRSDHFVSSYIARAPLALALERSFECHILSQHPLKHPILDLGCGDGIFASVLFGDMIDVGIDSDIKELERARCANKHEELICCGAEKIPKAEGHFKRSLPIAFLSTSPLSGKF